MHQAIELAKTARASQHGLADQQSLNGADDETEHLKDTTEASVNSFDVSSLRATDHDDNGGHLPPKPLKPLTNAQLFQLIAAILVVLAMTVLAIKVVAYEFETGNMFYAPGVEDCGHVDISSMEKGFYINLQVLRNLSATRAKLLDLAWNAVVGQGGRFLHAWVLYQVVASQITWMMEYSADGSFVTADSEDLQFCWSVDAGRLNGSIPAVVPGPRLGECYESFEYIDGTIIEDCNFTDGSDDWNNLLAYYRTADTIRWFYEGVPSFDAVDGTTDFDDWDYVVDPAWFGGARFWGSNEPKLKGLFREIVGFQFTGVGQGPAAENRTIATFRLDTSVEVRLNDEDLVDPVPYNSTLWFNDSAIALGAPFLSLPANDSACGWFAPVGGPCLCYRGSLLASDFRQDDNLVCMSAEGYSWGFSVMITVICILIEVCWALGCLIMWLDVHINSVLFRMGRRGSGVVRSILDLANAIQRDLGHDTGAYKDEELKKALDRRPPIGYAIDDSSQVDRIAIVSMPGPRRRRSQPRINPNVSYA